MYSPFHRVVTLSHELQFAYARELLQFGLVRHRYRRRVDSFNIALWSQRRLRVSTYQQLNHTVLQRIHHRICLVGSTERAGKLCSSSLQKT